MTPPDAPPPAGAPSAAAPFSFDDLPEVSEGSSVPAAWWLALGHLRAGAGEAFLSLVTVISIVGVLVGVALLNCVLAVMSGFEIDLRDKILGANAHVIVMDYSRKLSVDDAMIDSILEVEGVQTAAPFIYSEMMVRSRYGSSGVVFKGIDPVRSGDVTQVRDQLVEGLGGPVETVEERRALFEALAEPIPGDDPDDKALPGMILGDQLLADLGVRPGDTVQVINPVGSGASLMGLPTPTVKNFRVLGAFHSGMYEYDTKWVYVGNAQAQDFLKLDGQVTGIEVRVEDIDDVDRISTEIEATLGYPRYARHWRDLNQALFEALALEKIVMGLILGMIIVVAGLLIISNLYMMVLSKRREIAVLKAMGATRGTVLTVFLMVGGVIGLVGTTLGTALGYGGCHFLAWYEWPLETDVYYLSSLPVVIEANNFVMVATTALAICLVASVYPALRAAQLDPVEGLRYE